MKSIQPYIDAGWHTVPLAGTLARNADGSKTVPQFEKDWKSKYSKHFNTNATVLGGAITGQVSNIVAVDCDDQYTLDMFKALDPGYDHIYESLGKPSGGGTIIYSWADHIPSSFALHSPLLQLDFYNNDGFIYLPTAANTTKVTPAELLPVKPMPVLVERLVANLHEQYALSKGQRTQLAAVTPTVTRYQRAIVEQLVTRKTMDKAQAALTPKDFRTLPAYKEKGWLHPNEVPDGRGSEYLSKVSAILGADPSIDEDLYADAIMVINAMWSSPLPASRLAATIIQPMITGAATIGGAPIWQYDQEWENKGFTFVSKINEVYESFFDDAKNLYYALNTSTSDLKQFDTQSALASFIDGASRISFKRSKIINSIPIVHTIMSPALPEGYIDGPVKQLNLFRRTPELSVLYLPEEYKNYRRPEVTLQFLASLVPDEADRAYLLSWLKRKLLTFEYSPVVVYFLGVAGSGKDTFVNILRRFMGPRTFAKPSATEFCSQFNGWLENAYFVHLDEYGDQLSKHDKDLAKGRIKAYTGSSSVQIRRMNNDGYEARHSATFVMTANTNPLAFDSDDRRFFYIRTPNALVSQDWVQVLGGTAMLIDAIENESLDFAYYLATEVQPLSASAYMAPPMSEAKANLVVSSLSPIQQLAIYLRDDNWAKLEVLLADYNVALNDIVHPRDRIYWDSIQTVVQAIYPNSLSTTAISRELEAFGVVKHRTSLKRSGKIIHAFYVDTPGLAAYAADKIFTPQEDEDDVDVIH
jgi:hypothetical protein